MTYLQRYTAWCNDPGILEKEKKELLSIKEDDKAIQERFYEDITFGTAGLRGILGVGSNRMNDYNIRRATQALAQHIIEQDGKERGVVIAYDSRHRSKEFAKTTALVLCANGIQTYLFEDLRPVPELSFAIRHLNCEAGIVITASHNPKEYNGYKAYASYGGQLSPAASQNVMEHMSAIESLEQVKIMSQEQALAKNLLHFVGHEIDNAYTQALLDLRLNKDLGKKDDLCVVYTPLHGSGNLPVRTLLCEAGYTNLHLVKKQELPDGNFPTVSSPNPENDDALDLAKKLAQKEDADIILATDPDADRLCCAVKTKEGYQRLTGNGMSVVLLFYILESLKAQNRLSKESLVVRSIVSTPLADKICQHYGLQIEHTLTGFRYISERIAECSEMGKPFLFGFEESYGCLAGDVSRDKDAVLASLLFVEACHYYKLQNKTLIDVLHDIFASFRVHLEKTISIPFAGMQGQQNMADVMKTLRQQPLCSVAGMQTLSVSDYQEGFIKYADGQMESLTLPTANVLLYQLEGGCWMALRPSGTEPILKAYLGVCATTIEEANILLEQLSAFMIDQVNASAKE